MTTRRNRRLQLLGLAALFIGPLLLAAWLYYGDSGWRPGSQTQHGDLVSPPITLPEFDLATPAGARLTHEALRDKWTLLYVAEGECAERCRSALYDLRQVRLALGKEMTRVQRLLLYRGNCCDAEFITETHPDLLLAAAEGEDGGRLLEALPRYASDPMNAGRSYIVDPLGNLMMSYPADAEPRGILKDLKRLLRLSHIG